GARCGPPGTGVRPAAPRDPTATPLDSTAAPRTRGGGCARGRWPRRRPSARDVGLMAKYVHPSDEPSTLWAYREGEPWPSEVGRPPAGRWEDRSWPPGS